MAKFIHTLPTHLPSFILTSHSKTGVGVSKIELNKGWWQQMFRLLSSSIQTSQAPTDGGGGGDSILPKSPKPARLQLPDLPSASLPQKRIQIYTVNEYTGDGRSTPQTDV